MTMTTSTSRALRFDDRSGTRVTMMRNFFVSAFALSAIAAVTYTKDIKPIFSVKCATCHTTDGLGGHNIGSTYADVHMLVNTVDAPAGCFKDAAKTMPKTIGECTLPAIMEGWMPMAMGCFNTPRPDTCVSLAEQDVVAAWIAAGMPQ